MFIMETPEKFLYQNSFFVGLCDCFLPNFFRLTNLRFGFCDSVDFFFLILNLTSLMVLIPFLWIIFWPADLRFNLSFWYLWGFLFSSSVKRELYALAINFFINRRISDCDIGSISSKSRFKGLPYLIICSYCRGVTSMKLTDCSRGNVVSREYRTFFPRKQPW